MGFRRRMMNFMQGRYGVDNLFYGMSAVYITIMLINAFVHSWFLYILGTLICVLTFYRAFSRNVQKRYVENMKYMNLYRGAKGFFTSRTARLKQNKQYCFKKCPNCGKTLRLPRVKGKHSTRCPSCRAEFKVRVYFNKSGMRKP